MVIDYYLKPIMARGEGEKRPGSAGSLSAGTKDIPVDSASSYFDEGDEIFVVDTNLGNMSYCGIVQAVDSDSVTVCFGVRFTYDTGTPAYYVIRPADFFVFEKGYNAIRRIKDLGIENFETSGGVIYRTKIRDTKNEYQIGFSDLNFANRKGAEAFIIEKLNHGLDDFVIAFNDESIDGPNVLRGRLIMEDIDVASKSTILVDGRILFQEVSGYYV